MVEKSDSISRVDTPAGGLTGRFGPFRILLVEDSQFSQKLAVSLLAKEGHVVEVVSNGADALQRSVNSHYDFILMDIQMPEMDGLETTKRIRQKEEASQARRAPIIAMTAHAMLSDREICLAAGMDDYVTKPLRLEKLTSVFAGLVDQLAPTQTSESAGAGSGESWDWRTSLKTIGDAKLLEAIAVTFQADSHRLMTELHRTIGEGDAGPTAKAAAALRDTLKLFGEIPPLETVAKIATDAEQEQFDSIAKHMPVFDEQMSRFLADLVAYLALQKGPTPHTSSVQQTTGQ